MGIPPQPWQLKTFEDKYTPYFRPTHALPVPGFYATPTLTTTKAFPPERRPTSIPERFRPATDTYKAGYSIKNTTPGMGTASNVLDIWSELYRPKQPIKPTYNPTPPTVLSPSQKRRWRIAYASKLNPRGGQLTYLTPPSFQDLTKAPSADDSDPKCLRAYGELGKLKNLADLMERPSPPAGSEVWLRLGVGV